MSDEIKECPHCYGDAEHVECDRWHHVECQHCAMRGSVTTNDDEPPGSLRASAIDAWNGLPRRVA